MNPHDWLCMGLALGVTLAVTPLVRVGAPPGRHDRQTQGRSWHRSRLPCSAALPFFLALPRPPTSTFLDAKPWFYLGIFVFCLGLIDDIHHIRPAQKLLGQIVAAVALILSGAVLPWTSIGFVNSALTFVWIIGITNAINLLDNMDGLAAGISLIAATFFSLLLWQGGETAWSLLSASLAASLAGFLVFNHNPASIFMGDCGALFIGYVLSAVSLHATSSLDSDCPLTPIAIPALVLAVPIFDTTFVTILRSWRAAASQEGVTIPPIDWSPWVVGATGRLDPVRPCRYLWMRGHTGPKRARRCGSSRDHSFHEHRHFPGHSPGGGGNVFGRRIPISQAKKSVDCLLVASRPLAAARTDPGFVFDPARLAMGLQTGDRHVFRQRARAPSGCDHGARKGSMPVRAGRLPRLVVELPFGFVPSPGRRPGDRRTGWVLALVLASMGAANAAFASLFNFGILLALLASLRLLYPAVNLLIRLKQV